MQFLNFQITMFRLSCQVPITLAPFVLAKWLAQIFVDFNIFSKDEMNVLFKTKNVKIKHKPN